MSFKSAELKSLAEEAWAEGIPISASQCGHYFRYEQLAALVASAIDIAVDRRSASTNYEAVLAEVERLEELVSRRTTAIAYANRMRNSYWSQYQEMLRRIEDWYPIGDQIRDKWDDYYMVVQTANDLQSEIYQLEDELEAAQDEVDWQTYMVEMYTDNLAYWEDQVDELSLDWYNCMPAHNWYAPACQDIYDEWMEAEDLLGLAEDHLADAQNDLNYWQGQVEDVSQRLYADHYEYDHYMDTLEEIRAEIDQLYEQRGDLDELEAERDELHETFLFWQGKLGTYRDQLATLQENLVVAQTELEEATEEKEDTERAYERMIDRWW